MQQIQQKYKKMFSKTKIQKTKQLHKNTIYNRKMHKNKENKQELQKTLQIYLIEKQKKGQTHNEKYTKYTKITQL